MKDEHIKRKTAIGMACAGCRLDFYDKKCDPKRCHIKGFLKTADAVPVRKGNGTMEWIELILDSALVISFFACVGVLVYQVIMLFKENKN